MKIRAVVPAQYAFRRLRDFLMLMVALCWLGSAPVAHAAYLTVGSDLTPTFGNTIEINEGDTLGFTPFANFNADAYYYHEYPISYYFPFCGCYLNITGYGTPSGPQGPATWYDERYDGPPTTTLSASDTAGHGATISGNQSASRNLAFTFSNPGLYTLTLAATANYALNEDGHSCGGQAYAYFINSGSGWCTNQYDYNHSYAYSTSANKQYQVQVDELRVTSVPEPASWVMMLAGFGGLGAILRRRRSQGVLTA